MHDATRRLRALAAACALCVSTGALAPRQAEAASCETLASLDLPNGGVTMAQMTAAGAFATPGGGGRGAMAFAQLPAFCRVAATLQPTPRSTIKAEVWLPASTWNGKFQVVGNGGFAGTIPYAAMAAALAAGYAVAGTDTGHAGPAANTFVNDDVFVDYAYRAVHETTAAGKRIVDVFYGKPARFTYFSGCSTGGRQALQAIQRFPDDFDGVVAGAPGLHPSRQAFGQNWLYQAMAAPGAALGPDERQLLHDAVTNACDSLDGVRDGVIENPLACRFDPGTLVCRGDAASGCLTASQVEAARKIYAGATNPRTGERIFPGLEPGSELGWSAEPVGLAADFFRFLVFKDSNWDPKTLNFDSHVELASRSDGRLLDATRTDLTPYTRRGGKLILYQGWADPGIPPRNVVTYYENVVKSTPNAAGSVRLFMVPGMGHCGGGTGTSTFDMVAALDRWVEAGIPPARIEAARVRDGRIDRTRPLCPWPQQARYRGTGSTDDASSFVCR